MISYKHKASKQRDEFASNGIEEGHKFISDFSNCQVLFPVK